MGLRRRPALKMEEKNKIAQWLLQHTQHGCIKKCAQKQAAEIFEITIFTIRTIWKNTKKQIEKREAVHFASRRKSISHRDLKFPDVDRIKSLIVLERSTIRKMTSKLEVSKNLLGNWIKQKLLCPHTSAIKHVLSEANKIARLKLSLSQLQCDSSNENIAYNSMHGMMYIDEKWFFITKIADRFYLLPGEEDPYRTCKSKRYITKVMFMCAVSRPHIQSNGAVDFDGKIDIFPFTENVSAKRSSKNRVKGTLETKPIHSMNKEIIKECIINQVKLC